MLLLTSVLEILLNFSEPFLQSISGQTLPEVVKMIYIMGKKGRLVNSTWMWHAWSQKNVHSKAHKSLSNQVTFAFAEKCTHIYANLYLKLVCKLRQVLSVSKPNKYYWLNWKLY